MAVEKYSIGGTVAETEAFEAFADIPQNRVLLAEKLTVDAPVKPRSLKASQPWSRYLNISNRKWK